MANKRLVLAVFCAACTGFLPVSAVPYSNTTEDRQDSMLSYYPQSFVAKTLEKFNIPQAQRGAIENELADKDQEVIVLVEEKAEKMDPNPLRDPRYRQEAVKIFRDTLYEVFSQVMHSHGVTNSEELHSMLDDIQRQKAEYFAQTIEQKKQEAAKARDRSGSSLSRQPRGMEPQQ